MSAALLLQLWIFMKKRLYLPNLVGICIHPFNIMRLLLYKLGTSMFMHAYFFRKCNAL